MYKIYNDKGVVLRTTNLEVAVLAALKYNYPPGQNHRNFMASYRSTFSKSLMQPQHSRLQFINKITSRMCNSINSTSQYILASNIEPTIPPNVELGYN